MKRRKKNQSKYKPKIQFEGWDHIHFGAPGSIIENAVLMVRETGESTIKAKTNQKSGSH